MSYSPTPRQAELLRFVAGFQQAKGYSPSYQEMANALYRGHKGTAHLLMTRMQERGLIRTLPARARCIELLCEVPIPYGPNGEPMQFIAIGEAL